MSKARLLARDSLLTLRPPVQFFYEPVQEFYLLLLRAPACDKSSKSAGKTWNLSAFKEQSTDAFPIARLSDSPKVEMRFLFVSH
jgi:hypothetical protein